VNQSKMQIDFQSCAKNSPKPIFILKAGKSEEGVSVSMSHNGSLAGNNATYDGAFDSCGCIRVDSINDLWYIAHVIKKQQLTKGNRLCIVINADGPGVISTDCLIQNGETLTKLREVAISKLNVTLKLNVTGYMVTLY